MFPLWASHINTNKLPAWCYSIDPKDGQYFGVGYVPNLNDLQTAFKEARYSAMMNLACQLEVRIQEKYTSKSDAGISLSNRIIKMIPSPEAQSIVENEKILLDSVQTQSGVYYLIGLNLTEKSNKSLNNYIKSLKNPVYDEIPSWVNKAFNKTKKDQSIGISQPISNPGRAFKEAFEDAILIFTREFMRIKSINNSYEDNNISLQLNIIESYTDFVIKDVVILKRFFNPRTNIAYCLVEKRE